MEMGSGMNNSMIGLGGMDGNMMRQPCSGVAV